MADHVARVVDYLRSLPRKPWSAEILAGLEPADRITANLAARAAGLTTSWPTFAGVEPASAPDSFPACRGPLETTPLQAFESDADAGTLAPSTAGRWSAAEIARRADELCARPSEPDARRAKKVERPILFVQPTLLSPASPSSDALIAVITALSLAQNSSWILEPHVDALVGTITWARPTWLILDEEGADRVSAEISGLGSRERRHSRLSRVWVFAAQDPGKDNLDRWAGRLEASVEFSQWENG